MKNIFKDLKIKRRLIATLAGWHFYGNPSKELKVIGVTGTNGKTTTATLLYKIALDLNYRAGFIGTGSIMINKNEFKMDRKIPTTPDVLALNQIFSEMIKEKCEYVFMEVSSHALDQKRVAGINFTGGIFTNLTHDHLDYHKTFGNYFFSKKRFFQSLSKNAFALSNGDDEYGKSMIGDIKAQKYLYGFGGKKDSVPPTYGFFGEIKKLNFSGLELLFNGEKINSKLLGKFNAYNLLAVWSTCKLLGFDMLKVNKILENIEPPEGRFNCYTSKNGVLGIVDFAHTPDALENVLKTIKQIKESSYGQESEKMNQKIITVFGCGGDRDPSKRSIMMKIVYEMSDIIIPTADNPRSEDIEKIFEEMKKGLPVSEGQPLQKEVYFIADRSEAIKKASELAKSGDYILLAGKGHEQYQEIKGIKYPFNDTEELKKNFK